MKDLKEAIKQGEPCAVVHFDKNGKVTHEERYNLDKVRPSDYQLESMARCFLPQIREFFASEEGQRKYEEWKAKAKDDKTKVHTETKGV